MRLNQKMKNGLVAGLMAGTIQAIVGSGPVILFLLLSIEQVSGLFALPFILTIFIGGLGGLVFGCLYNKLPFKSYIAKGVVFWILLTTLITKPLVGLSMLVVESIAANVPIDSLLQFLFLLPPSIPDWLINGLIYGLLFGVLFNIFEKMFSGNCMIKVDEAENHD